MILIEGTVLHCFDPRMHFANTNLSFDDRYSYLDRALIRSKIHRDAHNYLVGEKLALKNEFMELSNNLLIIHMNKDEMKFFIILKGHVFAVTEDPEDTNIKSFFATHCFSIVDSYGKELHVNNYEEFSEFISAVKESQSKFDCMLDKYHKHMERLFELRKERESACCCTLGNLYNRLISLSDELGKEMCGALAAYHDSAAYNVIEKYIYHPSEEEKKCVLFGLYLAVLRAYKLNYDGEPLSLDERIHIGFMREYNYFLSLPENEGIIDKYAKYFNLRKIEIEIIKETLREEGLDGGDWFNEPAEINIL